MMPLVMANETGTAQHQTSESLALRNVVFGSTSAAAWLVKVPWKRVFSIEGDRPVGRARLYLLCSLESSCLGVQLKVRGKLLVRLNMTPRPIANKYREGKLKRTLKREFNST